MAAGTLGRRAWRNDLRAQPLACRGPNGGTAVGYQGAGELSGHLVELGMHSFRAASKSSLSCSLLIQQHLKGMFRRAGSCDRSGVHEEDLVYLLDRVQEVRDDDLGGLRRELGQNVFKKLLGDGVPPPQWPG
jgi:hypothetical protein